MPSHTGAFGALALAPAVAADSAIFVATSSRLQEIIRGAIRSPNISTHATTALAKSSTTTCASIAGSFVHKQAKSGPAFITGSFIHKQAKWRPVAICLG
jgi:hypothetical protein